MKVLLLLFILETNTRKREWGSNTKIKEIKKKRKKKKKLKRVNYNERFYIYQSKDNISEGFQILIPLPPNIELKGKSDLTIIIILFFFYIIKKSSV